MVGHFTEETGVEFRIARPDDVEQIRQSVRFTLANPEGRALRKRYEDAVDRREMLVLTRYDPRERASRVVGFVEWHSRVDGAATIRDLGTAGETPNPSILKRLLREFLRLVAPPLATTKVREDQPLWSSVFRETPGFFQDGREYTRLGWREIWTWTPEAERAALTPPARPTTVAGRPRRRL